MYYDMYHSMRPRRRPGERLLIAVSHTSPEQDEKRLTEPYRGSVRRYVKGLIRFI